VSDIAGYVKMTAREIRAFTDHEPKFRALYDYAVGQAHKEQNEARAKRSWLGRLFRSRWADLFEWGDLYDKHVPRWLRGDVLPDWAKRVRGLDDDIVILIDVDDARLLRWICESMKGNP